MPTAEEIEQWSRFDFKNCTQRENNPSSPRAQAQEVGIDPGEASGSSPLEQGYEVMVSTSQPQSSPSPAEETSEEIDLDSGSLPAYQEDIDIDIAAPPIYKRPVFQMVAVGSFVFLVALVVGSILSSAGNVKVLQTESGKPSKPQSSPTVDPMELENSRLRSDLANNQTAGKIAEINEKNQRQQVERSKGKPTQAADTLLRSERRTLGTTPTIGSRAATLSQIPPNRIPPTRYSAPVPVASTSHSRIPPAASVSPSTPKAESPTPELVSFGSMPESNQAVSFANNGYQTVSNSLSSQQDSFLSGQRQTSIQAGQSISGKVASQVIAGDQATIMVKTTQAQSGLPAGSVFVAQVTQFTEDGYLNAEATAVVLPNGSQTPLPAQAVTLSKPNGKLLQAKTKKGFFKSTFGRAVMGAVNELADQLTSRSESFSQTQFGTFSSRGAGRRDLTSLGGAAFKGLSRPLRQQQQTAGPSSLLLSAGSSVRLNVNQSFVVSQ